MEKNKLPIELSVGGHKFRLVVDWEDELVYRNAQRMLNDVYAEYYKRYPQKSVEELWVLTALQFAVRVNRQHIDEDASSVVAKMEELDADMERLLQDIKL